VSSYSKVLRPSSDCVHFIYENQNDGRKDDITCRMRDNRIRWAYVDYLDAKRSRRHIANVIAAALELRHAPYPPHTSPYQPKIWVPFLDDLIGLSLRQGENGFAIIVDNANVFLAEDSKNFFDLIEAFLTQFSVWFQKEKPCHIFFHMETNEIVRDIFAP
jgi:hypothetical protein